jgi:ABC-type branched-subunit amino acid transport system substrate-binding protein
MARSLQTPSFTRCPGGPRVSRAGVAAALLMAAAWSAQAQDAWVVGQSAPLTGSNGAFGRDIRDGAAAWFKQVNARGGAGGRNIELVTLDDGNDRKAAGANTQKLLDRGAVALFGYASATLSLDAMPLADKAGVLFFAPFSGANPVRTGPPVVFTLRASYADELEKMLAFWTGAGAKQVAVVHYEDEVGKQNLGVVADYLKKQGKTPAAFALQRNAKVSAEDVAKLLALKPDVIINTVLSGPAADISKLLAARGALVPTSSLSFVGAQQYIQTAGEAAAGVSISQVVPNPNGRQPVVAECAGALREFGVTAPMNSTHLEACIGAKVLTEAMRRAKKPGDARSLLAAMQGLGRYDAGGFVVTYGPNQNHGSKYVELGMVSRDGKLRN